MEMFDRVVLVKDLPEFDLRVGDVGAIVEIFEKPYRAYLLEFNSNDGDLVALPTVEESDIRQLRDDDMFTVRTVTDWYGSIGKPTERAHRSEAIPAD